MTCTTVLISCNYVFVRFKPVQVLQLVSPVREEFEQLFHATFSVKQNAKFLANIQVWKVCVFCGEYNEVEDYCLRNPGQFSALASLLRIDSWFHC